MLYCIVLQFSSDHNGPHYCVVNMAYDISTEWCWPRVIRPIQMLRNALGEVGGGGWGLHGSTHTL